MIHKILYYLSKKFQLNIITRLVAKAVADLSKVDRLTYHNVNPVSAQRRRHTKYTTVAVYFGCHSRIHAPIFAKISGLREDMMLVHNPEYLLIRPTAKILAIFENAKPVTGRRFPAALSTTSWSSAWG